MTYLIALFLRLADIHAGNAAASILTADVFADPQAGLAQLSNAVLTA